MLRPIETSTREVKSLDGLWRFAIPSPSLDSPWRSTLPGDMECPVPASYNDIFPNHPLRRHVGMVWYQRAIIIPRGWADAHVFLRFDCATHEAEVYVNDTLLTKHVGGYTPFEADLSGSGFKAGQELRLTVGVSNVLTRHSVPPGELVEDDIGEKRQVIRHDFFNYAGLARSVKLCAIPKVRVDDVTVVTDVKGTEGFVKVDVAARGDYDKVQIDLLDGGETVATSSTLSSTLSVPDAKLWQPGAAYLYTLRARLFTSNELADEYTLSVGIRSVRVEGLQFLINDKPFYFTGFGRHEDIPIKGKAHDDAWMVHDFELMKWCNANSFRTSHYPYAEEVYDYADRHGIVVIDETAAVGMNLYIAGGLFGGGKEKRKTFSDDYCDDVTRDALMQAVRELVARDKNHPSVVMWCITNEPGCHEAESRAFFSPIVELCKSLDPRPVTYTNLAMAPPDVDKMADLFDVICLNRYYGWYEDTGDLAAAERHLEAELREWQDRFQRPLIITEYGADTVAGLHQVDAQPWSEEYQAAYYEVYHRVFDRVKAVVGEQAWNFADFSTGPGIIRVDGNKKGVFTRDRRPKMAAHVLKKRWEGKAKAEAI